MDAMGHFLLVLLITLLVITAFTFGFMLIVWFVAFAIAVAILVILRDLIRRGLFLYRSRDRVPVQKPKVQRKASAPKDDWQPPPRVIEGDYKDITDKKR